MALGPTEYAVKFAGNRDDMAQFSEVDRIEAAIRNQSAKELSWSLWYCRMRQSIPSARPADVRYWAEVEARVEQALTPAPEAKQYPAKKKKSNRGLGSQQLGGPGA